MPKASRNTVIKRILIAVAVTLALLYIVFLFVTTNFLGSNNIVTETAYRATAYDVIKSNAYIIRDESYIENSSSGIVVYNVDDAEKVTAGGAVATVYKNESDVIARQQIAEIDERIAYLQSLSAVTAMNAGLDTVNSQLSADLVALIENINRRSFDQVDDASEQLMSSIYRKQIITGEQLGFDDRIAELTIQRKQLVDSCGEPSGEVTTASSGYFVSSVDGYEQVFDVSHLDEITYADYQNAAPADVDDRYIGKVIKGVNWYILCPITEDDAVNITHNASSVSVRLPYVTGAELPAKVVSVNRFSDETMSMAVIACNYMDASLSHIRRESVEIVVGEYEGLKFSKSALHDDYVERTVTANDGTRTTERQKVQGVYVEYGNELLFKQVSILYAGDDYVICNENPDPDVLYNGTTVTLYDKVVIEGSDLFDGKILD